MKTKNQFQILAIGLLLTSSSFAQTAKPNDANSIESQITMTQDYTQSLLNSIQNTPVDRFKGSQDYAIEGPKLKATMEAFITEFRAAMDNLMIGSFTDAVNDYNKTFNENKATPDPKTQQRLAIQKQVLEQQVSAVSAVYQGEIKRLYETIPSLVAVKFTRKSRLRFVEGKAINGFKESAYKGYYAQDLLKFFSLNTLDLGNREKNGEYCFPREVVNAYHLQLDYFFREQSNCKTRVCYSGILKQISSYILYVDSYLNRNIPITIGDSTITISALKGQNGSMPSYVLTKAIQSYRPGAYYVGLPLKN